MRKTRSNWHGHRLTESEHRAMRLLEEAGELRRKHKTPRWLVPGKLGVEPRYATQTGVIRRLADKGLLVIIGDSKAILP